MYTKYKTKLNHRPTSQPTNISS